MYSFTYKALHFNTHMKHLCYKTTSLIRYMILHIQ